MSFFIFIIWLISGILNIVISCRKDEDTKYWKIQYWFAYGVLMLVLLGFIIFS